MVVSMTNIFRTSIAARSAAIILLIVGLVGLFLLALAIPLTEHEEEIKQQARLNELLDTVQRTVSIACFLSDKQLADEVARGLLSNRTVSQVTVIAGSVQLTNRSKVMSGPLASAGSSLPPGSLVRKIQSPFNADETVGEIALVPDAAEIRSNVLHASWFTALLIMGQVVFIGIGVVLVVIRLITRPISTNLRPTARVARGDRSEARGAAR